MTIEFSSKARFILAVIYLTSALGLTACGGGGEGSDGAASGDISGDTSGASQAPDLSSIHVLRSTSDGGEITGILITDSITLAYDGNDGVLIENPDNGLLYKYKFVETSDAIKEYIYVFDEGNEANNYLFSYYNGYLSEVARRVLFQATDFDPFWIYDRFALPLPPGWDVKPIAAGKSVLAHKNTSPGDSYASRTAGRLRDDYAADCKLETDISREISCHILDMVYKPLDILVTPFFLPPEAGVLENLPAGLRDDTSSNLTVARDLVDSTNDKLNLLSADIEGADLLAEIDEAEQFIQTQEDLTVSYFRPIKEWFVSYYEAIANGSTTAELELLDIPEISHDSIIDFDDPEKICTAPSSQTLACDIVNGTGEMTRSCVDDTFFDYWGPYGECQISTCDAGYKEVNGKCEELSQSYAAELAEVQGYAGETCYIKRVESDLKIEYEVACVQPRPGAPTTNGLEITLYQRHSVGKTDTQTMSTKLLTCASGCMLLDSVGIEESMSGHVFKDVSALLGSKSRLIDGAATVKSDYSNLYLNPASAYHNTTYDQAIVTDYTTGVPESWGYYDFLRYEVYRNVDGDVAELCIDSVSPGSFLYNIYIDLFTIYLYPGSAWVDAHCNLSMPAEISLEPEIADMVTADNI